MTSFIHVELMIMYYLVRKLLIFKIKKTFAGELFITLSTENSHCDRIWFKVQSSDTNQKCGEFNWFHRHNGGGEISFEVNLFPFVFTYSGDKKRLVKAVIYRRTNDRNLGNLKLNCRVHISSKYTKGNKFTSRLISPQLCLRNQSCCGAHTDHHFIRCAETHLNC